MDSYILRISRRSVGDIAGTVEAVEAGTRTGFADGPELLVILGCPPRAIVVAPTGAPRQDQTHGQQQ